MEYDPKDRYGNADEALNELRHLSNNKIDAVSHAQKQRSSKITYGYRGRLYVRITPIDAAITILNSNLSFYQGIELKSDYYEIQASKDGFQNESVWTLLLSGEEKYLEILLKPAEQEKTHPNITNSIGMMFVYIRPGTFIMGSPVGEHGRDDRETQHQVILNRGFFMQTTVVTHGQWKAVMGNRNLSFFKRLGDDYPVEDVYWDDVQHFVCRLNEKEGTDKYRLPTEAEWECACRAGTRTRFYWGNSADCCRANFGNSSWSDECFRANPGKPMKVASFPPNAWGLYDMHGNVWEFCQDFYGDYPNGSVNDPVGPSSGVYRVLRGGGWGSASDLCRSASRFRDFPYYRDNDVGFRVVMNF